MNPLEITTARLKLRQWSSSDIEPFARMSADQEVMKYFPNVLNRDQSETLIGRFSEKIDQYGWGFWALEDRQSGEFIGLAGLNAIDDTMPFYPAVEVGWRLASDYWRQGYAYEAASAALQFGFSDLDLTEIVAFTSVENTASWKLMEKLRMRPSGTFEHPAIPDAHWLKTHYLYRLNRDQWQPQTG